MIKSKEVVGSTSKGKKAGPPTEEVQSIANKSNVGSDAEMQSEIGTYPFSFLELPLLYPVDAVDS